MTAEQDDPIVEVVEVAEEGEAPPARRRKRVSYKVRAFALQPGRHVLLTDGASYRIYPADQWPSSKPPSGTFNMDAEQFEALLEPVDFSERLAEQYGTALAQRIEAALWLSGVVAPGDVITPNAKTRVLNAAHSLAREALAALEE